jgi:hypothetical protein
MPDLDHEAGQLGAARQSRARAAQARVLLNSSFTYQFY